MVKNTIFDLLKSTWPTLTIFLVIIILIRIFSRRNSNKRLILHEEIINLLFITYILLLFELVTSKDVSSSTNFIPFKEILRYDVGTKNFYEQVVGNIILFIPFGFFVSYYTKIRKISSSLLISGLVSLTIEIVQRYIGRSFDVDDIILNALGGMIGFLIFIALDAIKNKMPGFMKRDWFLSLVTVILLVLGVLYLFGRI